MKRLFVFLAMVMICGTANAWELSLEPMYTIYNSSGLKNELGAKIRLGYDAFYAWASEERAIRRFRDQDAMRLALWGYGIGAEIEVFKGLYVSADIGRYEPKIRTWPAPVSLSGGYPQWLLDIDDDGWHYFQYRIDKGYGGSIGMRYRKDLGDRWRFGAGLAYRYLELREDVIGRDYYFAPNSTTHWYVNGDQSFSGMQLGFSFSYQF